MMQRPYQDADLRAYSAEHLWYELWMFYEAVDVLSRQQSPSASSSVWSTASGPTVAAPRFGVPNTIAPPVATVASVTIVTTNAYVEVFMGASAQPD